MTSQHQCALGRLFLNIGCGSRVANENTRHADYDVVGFPIDRTTTGIRVGLLNVRSVTKRSTAISDIITSRCLDVFALTKTWHRASDDLSLKRCAPPGYSTVDSARSHSETRDGGVALIHSNRFVARRLKFDVKPSTFEVLGCSLRSTSSDVVIYRPGSEAVSEWFLDELTELLEVVAMFRSQAIVIGDFNVHVNDLTDHHANRLKYMN